MNRCHSSWVYIWRLAKRTENYAKEILKEELILARLPQLIPFFAIDPVYSKNINRWQRCSINLEPYDIGTIHGWQGDSLWKWADWFWCGRGNMLNQFSYSTYSIGSETKVLLTSKPQYPYQQPTYEKFMHRMRPSCK